MASSSDRGGTGGSGPTSSNRSHRSPGELRRAQLRQEALETGNDEYITKLREYEEKKGDEAKIDKYYKVSKALLDKFEKFYRKRQLDDAYVYGKRFASFAINELKTHSDYNKQKYDKQKQENGTELESVLSKLKEVIGLIDTEEEEKIEEKNSNYSSHRGGGSDRSGNVKKEGRKAQNLHQQYRRRHSGSHSCTGSDYSSPSAIVDDDPPSGEHYDDYYHDNRENQKSRLSKNKESSRPHRHCNSKDLNENDDTIEYEVDDTDDHYYSERIKHIKDNPRPARRRSTEELHSRRSSSNRHLLQDEKDGAAAIEKKQRRRNSIHGDGAVERERSRRREHSNYVGKYERRRSSNEANNNPLGTSHSNHERRIGEREKQRRRSSDEKASTLNANKQLIDQTSTHSHSSTNERLSKLSNDINLSYGARRRSSNEREKVNNKFSTQENSNSKALNDPLSSFSSHDRLGGEKRRENGRNGMLIKSQSARNNRDWKKDTSNSRRRSSSAKRRSEGRNAVDRLDRHTSHEPLSSSQKNNNNDLSTTPSGSSPKKSPADMVLHLRIPRRSTMGAIGTKDSVKSKKEKSSRRSSLPKDICCIPPGRPTDNGDGIEERQLLASNSSRLDLSHHRRHSHGHHHGKQHRQLKNHEEHPTTTTDGQLDKRIRKDEEKCKLVISKYEDTRSTKTWTGQQIEIAIRSKHLNHNNNNNKLVTDYFDESDHAHSSSDRTPNDGIDLEDIPENICSDQQHQQRRGNESIDEDESSIPPILVGRKRENTDTSYSMVFEKTETVTTRLPVAPIASTAKTNEPTQSTQPTAAPLSTQTSQPIITNTSISKPPTTVKIGNTTTFGGSNNTGTTAHQIHKQSGPSLSGINKKYSSQNMKNSSGSGKYGQATSTLESTLEKLAIVKPDGCSSHEPTITSNSERSRAPSVMSYPSID